MNYADKITAAMVKRSFDDDALAESLTGTAPLVGLLGGAYAGLSPSLNPALGLYKELPGATGRTAGRAGGFLKALFGSDKPTRMAADMENVVNGNWIARLLGGGKLLEGVEEAGARGGWRGRMDAVRSMAAAAKRLKGRSRALAIALGLALPALGFTGGRVLEGQIRSGERK